MGQGLEKRNGTASNDDSKYMYSIVYYFVNKTKLQKKPTFCSLSDCYDNTMDKETENTSKQNTNFDLKTSTPKNVPRHYDYGNKSHHSTASENEEFHISSFGYKSGDTLLTDRVLPTNARPNNHPDSLKDIAANFRLVKPQTPGDKSYHSVQEDEHLYHSFQV